MATIRRKKPEPFALLQRDPGPWSPILLYWLATLGIIIVFGLVMLFSASYTTGYLRFGDSLHYIKSQVLCLGLGLVAMFLFSYVDHRLLRRLVWPGYFLVLALLVLVLFSTPLNGCKRWLRVAGMTVQVSEIAKFEMILLTAHIAAKAPRLEKLDPSRSGQRQRGNAQLPCAAEAQRKRPARLLCICFLRDLRPARRFLPAELFGKGAQILLCRFVLRIVQCGLQFVKFNFHIIYTGSSFP